MRTNATHPGPLLRACARVLLRVCLLLAALTALPTHAQRMPQDSWYLAKEVAIPDFGGVFQSPGRSAIGPDGNLYVTDRGNRNIQVFDADGKFIKFIFKNGQDNIWLNYINGIAISDNGTIYVCDGGTFLDAVHILVLDKDGKLINSFGQNGNNEGQINSPYAIALDNEGNVYVAEPQLNRVSVFKPDGTFVKTWGSKSAGDSQLISIKSICRTNDNNIAVLDTGAGTIKIFNPDGTCISNFNLGWTSWQSNWVSNPQELNQDSAGNFYITSHWPMKITVCSPTGEWIRSFGSYGNEEAQFGELFGISLKGDKVYLSDYQHARIVTFKTDGSWQKNFGTPGYTSPGQMRGIAQDVSGNIFISDADHASVLKFDAQGRLLKSFGSRGSGSGNFDNPGAIAIGNNQQLYVVDVNNNRIQIFDLDGNFIGKFGNSGTSPGSFNLPYGIAIGRDGKVYVSDRGNHRIQVFDADGKFSSTFGASGSLDGQFKNPGKLSVSSTDGKLAVCDEGNNRVQVFNANGDFHNKCSTFAGELGRASYKLYYDSSYSIINNSPSSPSEVNFLADGCFIVHVPGDLELTSLFSQTGDLTHYWQSEKLNYYPFNPSVSSSREEARNKTHQDYYNSRSSITASCPNASGDMYAVTSRGTLQLWKRTYRVQQPPQANALPFPYILSQSRRAGTSLVDVDYIVKDADDDTVQTAALAFKNGGNTLWHVIPIVTLAEGTASNLGPKITTAQPHRFTWDAKSDWNTDFGEVQIEILAKDKRDFLNLDFIQIPAVPNKPDKPALKISRSPLTDNDFLSVWYWFLATGDPDITLSKGEVKPVNALIQTGTVNYDGTKGSPGWNVTFYPNTNWQNGVERKDLFVNISPTPPVESQDLPFQSSSFIAYYRSKILPSSTGTYRFFGPEILYSSAASSSNYFEFYLTAPDKSYSFSVWPSPSANSRPSLDVALTAGVSYGVECRYTCSDPNQFGGIRLSWERPDGVEELIPPTNVFDGNTWENQGGGSISFPLPDQSYASFTRTNPAGRAFLLTKMGLREATPAEVLRAKEAGTPGNINQWDPKFQVGPWERPLKVNAYGFDTGASGTWVVPLNN